MAMRTAVKTILDAADATVDQTSTAFSLGENYHNVAFMVAVTGADGAGTITIQGSLDGVNYAPIGRNGAFSIYADSADTFLKNAAGTHSDTPALFGQETVDGYSADSRLSSSTAYSLINEDNLACRWVRVVWSHGSNTTPFSTITIQVQASQ